jgi:hypothetical protein
MRQAIENRALMEASARMIEMSAGIKEAGLKELVGCDESFKTSA